MKKSLETIASLLFACVLFASCGDSEVKEFVTNFQKAVEAKDSVNIVKMYPDAKDFAVEMTATENMEVEAVNDTDYLVEIGEGKNLMVTTASDGTMTISASHGLLAIPASDKTLASKTGWVKKDLTDKQNAKRLKNEGFRAYMNGKLNALVSEKVTIGPAKVKELSRRATDWFDSYHTDPISWDYVAEISFEVKNDLDAEIAADAYSCNAVISIYGYWDAVDTKNQEVQTQKIPAKGTATVTCKYNGSEECVEGTGGIKSAVGKLTFNYDKFDITKLYTFNGHEYDDYVAQYGESYTSCDGTYIGVLGGDNNSVLTITNNNGTYTFVGQGGRTIKVITYNAATKELFLEAYAAGGKIGEFKGILTAEGKYSGTFQNTKNGAKLSFSYTKK